MHWRLLSGRILNRFSKDMGQVDELLPNTFVEFLFVSIKRELNRHLGIF